MNYKYEGLEEFKGSILECDIPIEDWEFGTSVNFILYQPERLSEKTVDDGSDSLNSVET